MIKKIRPVFLPVILIPSYLSLKNFILRDALKSDNLIRLISGTCFGLILMSSIYRGGFKFLEELQKQRALVFLHPSIILNLLLFSLFIMLFFTNFFSATHQIFISKDLDLVHKSPISFFTFLAGNALKTYLLTSWMSLIFIIPILLFLAQSEGSGPSFYLISSVVCLIFFSLPTSLAYLFASVYPIILPNKFAKTFIKLILIGLVLLTINSLLLTNTQSKGSQLLSLQDLTRLLPILTFINTPYFPSYWTATILGEYLVPSGKSIYIFGGALFSLSILSISLSYISLKTFYPHSLTLIKSSYDTPPSSSRKRERALRTLMSFMPSLTRGIIIKDYRIFSRNVGQAGQMIMLLFLTASYLYIVNFQVGFVSQLQETDKIWWISALTISNSCLEAFIALALGTRIIYPQWSFEGKSIWLLQSSPNRLKDVFNAKFTTWYIPSSIFLATLFTLSLFALNASTSMLVIKFTSTLITTYSLIGLGLGLGAYFSDFNTENPGEVAGSFGSLLFMLLGFVIIFTNLLILSFIFSNSTGVFLAFDSTKDLQLGRFSLAMGVVFILINISVAKIALFLGRSRLEGNASK